MCGVFPGGRAMDEMGMNKAQHVVPNRDGGWAVRKAGSSRASRVFPTQLDAVQYARQAARREGSALYARRGDGAIKDRHSFGPDTVPSPAKH